MQEKSVIISIQPKWCELIANGKKTIEVRKTKPKLKPPFKCYIYCTKSTQSDRLWGLCKNERKENFGLSAICANLNATSGICLGDGKVIGEFVCDDIFEIVKVGYTMREALQYRAVKDCTVLSDDIFDHSCLSKNAIEKYLDGRKGYAWHISKFVIYEKPKELSEFATKCNKNCETGCNDCEYYHFEAFESAMGVMECCRVDGLKPLKRPPQSWCYVHKLDDIWRKEEKNDRARKID